MIFCNIDVSEVAELLDLDKSLKKMCVDAGRDLAGMIDAKAKELAAAKLHTRRKMFTEGLKVSSIGEDSWLVSLDAKVRWIDDGQSAYDMLEGLLGSKKARTAKDGSKYIIVPFDHSPGKGKTGATPAQQDLISTVKSELKKRGIPFGSIEKDAAGQALQGRLHSFDISTSPIRGASQTGPGHGKGPVGSVKRGPTGIPLLEGVTVYQGKSPTGKTNRSVLTFRIASSKHKDQGRWDHPGNAPINIMEEAAEWAVETWTKEVVPALLDKAVLDTK